MKLLNQVLVVCGASFITHAKSQFSLYPAVDSDRLAAAFNISSNCLTALNTTVECDQTLLTMAGTVDNYLWDIDNVTTLCTSDCLTSTQTWFNAVNESCSSDTMTVLGKQVPAYTIPGRTIDGLNIACLTPTTDVSTDPGTSGSIVTTTNETDSTDGSASKRQSTSSGYCLIDSYNWVGSDIIRPDCSLASNQNESQCIDPTDVTPDNERIANLYSNDVLCDACFIDLFYLRLASPYLPDVDYSDYLILQYYDILDVCGKTGMPDLIVRLTPDYADADGFFNGKSVNTTSLQPFISGSSSFLPNATTSAGNGTCAGQELTLDQLVKVADGLDISASFCDALSKAFNVTSGDLYQAFANYGCDTPYQDSSNITWCVPDGCSIYQPSINATCAEVVAAVSTPEHNITTQQLVQYNPNLQGTCDLLQVQYICITPPGGAYIPPPTNATSTNSTSQQRGGGDGSSTGNSTVGTGNPTVTVPAGGAAPSPTQSGIISSCRLYSNTSIGDTCDDFAQEHSISLSDFFAWNTMLGTNGADCSTEFWSGYFYCVGTSVSATTTTTSSTRTTTTTPTTTAASAPSPTQSGIVSTCDKYAIAPVGGTCYDFANSNGITTTEFYTWNTQLGADGENCSSEFWAGYYYCTHAP